MDDWVDLNALNDDILGHIISRIVDWDAFTSVCMASKRFYKIYINVKNIIMTSKPTRVDYYYNPFNIGYRPCITQKIHHFCNNLLEFLHARMYTHGHDDEVLWAIYYTIYDRCDRCNKHYNQIDRGSNTFFKLTLNAIIDDTIGHIIVDITKICDECVPELKNNHPVYYLHYIRPDNPKDIILPVVNYKIRKVTLNARIPAIINNPEV
jgi:hypothetical protein